MTEAKKGKQLQVDEKTKEYKPKTDREWFKTRDNY